MNRLSKVISFERAIRNNATLNDVKSNPGGGAVLRCEQFADAGDDSQPLALDYCAVMGVVRSNGNDGVVLGYVDIINAGKAGPGEKRIYGRDQSGSPVNEVWCKNDGTIQITNTGGGSIVMAANGVITMNQAVIDLDGNITTPGTVTGGEVKTDSGVDLDTHTHSGVQPGPSNTGPPN